MDPLAIAYAARDAMVLPSPQMEGSPRLEAEQLVGVPVWLWLEEESWEPVSAQASVPGGSVSVTATPVDASWDMGDGSSVTCDGPGTPFDASAHAADAASPDCGHTYTRSSATRSNGEFPVEVDVAWTVTWETSDGDGGELEPLASSASSGVAVGESHGVVTRG